MRNHKRMTFEEQVAENSHVYGKNFGTQRYLDIIWSYLAPVNHSGLWLVPCPKGRGKKKVWEMKFPWPPSLLTNMMEKIKPVAIVYSKELSEFMVDALNHVSGLLNLCRLQRLEIIRLKKRLQRDRYKF